MLLSPTRYSTIETVITIAMADQATSQDAPSSPTSPAPKRARTSPKGTADAPASSPQQAAEAQQPGAGQEAFATTTSPLEEDDIVEAVCSLVGGYEFVAY